MASKHCASCQKFFKETFKFCPYCGQKVRVYTSVASDYQKVIEDGLKKLEEKIIDNTGISDECLSLYYGFVSAAIEMAGEDSEPILRTFISPEKIIDESAFEHSLHKLRIVEKENTLIGEDQYCDMFSSKFAYMLAYSLKFYLEDIGLKFEFGFFDELIQLVYEIKRVGFGYHSLEEAIDPYPYTYDSKYSNIEYSSYKAPPPSSPYDLYPDTCDIEVTIGPDSAHDYYVSEEEISYKDISDNFDPDEGGFDDHDIDLYYE